MQNEKAIVSGEAVKKIILDRLQHKILELIHMVLHISKTYDEFMSIIINWG
jgi:hypothetical protein